MTNLRDITIIIKTFERPYCLQTLLRSIQSMQLPCPVLIADDSQCPYNEEMVQQFGNLITHYIILPFDSGTSMGRNVLVEHVTTSHFVLCDDDFIFDKRADLRQMHQILTTTDTELLGGMFYNRVVRTHSESLLALLLKLKLGTAWQVIRTREKITPFFGRYHVEDNVWYAKPIVYMPPYTRCDFVNNFFMAKTAAFREKGIMWDESLKQLEHEPFFFVAKQKGLKVAVSKEVGVIHQPIITKGYMRFRQRPDYKKQFMQANGLTRYVDEMRGIDFSL